MKETTHKVLLLIVTQELLNSASNCSPSVCNKYESACLLRESAYKILNSACNSLPSAYNKYESACDEHRSECKTA